GCGLAVFLEKSGGGEYEDARVTVEPTGAVRVDSGGASLGQGIETALARIVADALAVEPERVTVVAGDTGALEHGAGSWASGATMTYPYGVHLAQVEVDPETGGVGVLRYFVGYEVGHAVEPVLVQGQLVGGVAQGLGGALLEEFRYAQSGQPLSASFMDYLLP